MADPAAAPVESVGSGSTRHLRPARAPQAGLDEAPCFACAHGKQAHLHYRRGTDCALCACGRYRGRSLLGRLVHLGR
jgi:hypothetical protein